MANVGPSFDSTLPPVDLLPPSLRHGSSSPPQFEVLLARRSAGQAQVHERLRLQGVDPAKLPAGADFRSAAQRQNASARCTPSGYASIRRLADKFSLAARGLTQWWSDDAGNAIPGQMQFRRHGQWGIFGNEHRGVKTNFIHRWLCDYQSRRQIRTICEIGFMAGHSSLLFLETATQARVVSFDLGDCPWTRPQGELLATTYGRERFELVLGLSNNTIHAYAREHPGLRCDVVMVDGSKFPEPRYLDLQSFRALSRCQAVALAPSPKREHSPPSPPTARLRSPGAVLFYDEASSLACVNGSVPPYSRMCGGFEGAARAYNRAAREGLVRVVDCAWAGADDVGYRRTGDGSCVAEYL